MKKLFCSVLALCLLLAAVPALADVDLSYLESEPDVFRIQESGNVTIICDTLGASDLAFEHANDNGKLYSFTCFTLQIPAGSDVVYPALDVIYCADAPLNITTVSFDVAGVRYTFAVNSTGPQQDEDGIVEDCLIIFGMENYEFLQALAYEVQSCADIDDLLGRRYTAILHGDEDVTATLGGTFLLDYSLVIVEAFSAVGGLNTISQLSGSSAMMTEDLAQE